MHPPLKCSAAIGLALELGKKAQINIEALSS